MNEASRREADKAASAVMEITAGLNINALDSADNTLGLEFEDVELEFEDVGPLRPERGGDL